MLDRESYGTERNVWNVKPKQSDREGKELSALLLEEAGEHHERLAKKWHSQFLVSARNETGGMRRDAELASKSAAWARMSRDAALISRSQ